MKGADIGKISEILEILLRAGPLTPYEIYKRSSLTLATAYRYIKRVTDNGLARESYGLIEITLKGIILLALLGSDEALDGLSRYFGFDRDIINALISELRSRCVTDLELESIRINNALDILSCLMINNDLLTTVKYFKDKTLEPLIAYILINSLPTVTLSDGSKMVLSDGGVLAIACRRCGIAKNSKYRNRHDSNVYRLLCDFECVKNSSVRIVISVNGNSSFQDCEKSPYKSIITISSNGSTKDRD